MSIRAIMEGIPMVEEVRAPDDAVFCVAIYDFWLTFEDIYAKVAEGVYMPYHLTFYAGDLTLGMCIPGRGGALKYESHTVDIASNFDGPMVIYHAMPVVKTGVCYTNVGQANLQNNVSFVHGYTEYGLFHSRASMSRKTFYSQHVDSPLDCINLLQIQAGYPKYGFVLRNAGEKNCGLRCKISVTFRRAREDIVLPTLSFFIESDYYRSVFSGSGGLVDAMVTTGGIMMTQCPLRDKYLTLYHTQGGIKLFYCNADGIVDGPVVLVPYEYKHMRVQVPCFTCLDFTYVVNGTARFKSFAPVFRYSFRNRAWIVDGLDPDAILDRKDRSFPIVSSSVPIMVYANWSINGSIGDMQIPPTKEFIPVRVVAQKG